MFQYDLETHFGTTRIPEALELTACLIPAGIKLIGDQIYAKKPCHEKLKASTPEAPGVLYGEKKYLNLFDFSSAKTSSFGPAGT